MIFTTFIDSFLPHRWFGYSMVVFWLGSSQVTGLLWWFCSFNTEQLFVSRKA